MIANSQVLKAKVALALLLCVDKRAHLSNEKLVDDGAQEKEDDTAERTDKATDRVALVTVEYC